ncbi:MAG: TlpA family protein disulfide reductase [Deltaproteobacteria bacterium]|nr:TlpA family protein disulfide reductase [Deltaproteobacteria bacterium]
MRRTFLAVSLLCGLLVGLTCSTDAAGPGEVAPTFAAPTLDGGQFDLAGQVGKKVVVLDWWSINCTSCVQEIPALIDIAERYPKDVQVVGMNVDSFILKRVQRFLQTQSFKITYPIVIDAGLQIMKKYGSSILPTTVVIDKKGKIAFTHIGYKPGDEVTIDAVIKKAIAGK